MARVMRVTILGTIAGVILAFNMYHADYKLLVAQIGAILLVAMGLLRFARNDKLEGHCEEPKATKQSLRNVKPNIVQVAMLAYLGICVLSFAMSPHKLVSWQELSKIGAWIIFGLALSTIDRRVLTDRFLSRLVDIWIFCAVLVAIYGTFQFFDIDFLRFELPGNRIVANFGNATLLAGFLGTAVPLALGKAMSQKIPQSKSNAKPKTQSIERNIYIAATFALLFCLMLTKGRGGMLAAMVGSLIMIAWLKKTHRGYRRALTLLLTMSAIGLTLFMIPHVRHTISDVILRRTTRLLVWNDTMRMIELEPLFGTGIGTFTLYFPKFVSKLVLIEHPIEWAFINHAHNEYLEILSEMGIVGLTGFLFVIGAVIFRFLKTPQKNILHVSLFAAFIAILVSNLVSVELRYTSTGIFFWLLAGIMGTDRQPQAHLDQNTQPAYCKNPILNTIIIILAGLGIYLAVKPYANIQDINMESNFFKQRDAGKIEKRIEAIEGRAQNSNSVEHLFSLGILHAKKKDFDKAKGFFINTVKRDMHHAGAFNNLGNIAILQGNDERAIALFRKASLEEPDNSNYVFNFAAACFKVNRIAEATDAVEEVLRIDPENTRAQLLLRQMTQ